MFPNDLAEPGRRLLAAAEDYWKAFNKLGSFGAKAVVWLEADDGALVVMTRGEYGQDLKDLIRELR
jgi:hypothetical protein